MKINRRLLKVFFIAPFNIMLVLPALILLAAENLKLLEPYRMSFAPVRGILGGLLIAAGAVAAYRCVSLLTQFGEGTPAPWDPPKRLVVRGLYRQVRNPLVEAAALVLLGESVVFGSWPLCLWFFFFVIVNIVYTPLVEEPELLRRFGDPYRTYMQNVPRWIPRKHPWQESDPIS